jgi:Ran GTPase-activating protein (RanGAP) involved in mRNA processing and transport
MEHSSLTDIDLSNDDSNQNKNKLGNAGLEAIIEGILDSSQSVISMLNVAQNNIQFSVNPETFTMLRALLTVKSEQLLSLNLSDNDLGPEFISTIGYQALSNLKELQLANTRLNKKSLTDLSDMINRHRFSLLNLDLSSNRFDADSLFKFFNAMKNNQSLRRINLSRNDFSLGEEGPIGGYFSIFE